MKTLVEWVVVAILRWAWKKFVKIQAKKHGKKARSNIAKHELAIYKDFLEEILESEIEPEVADELIVESARQFLAGIDSL